MISRHDQEAGSRTEDQLNQDSKDQLGPQLLALPMIKPTYISAVAAVGAISLFFVAFGWTEISNQETPFKPAHQIVVVPPEKTAGAISAVDIELATKLPHVFNALQLPESEKARLRSKLDTGQLRIGAIELWDNVDEDGDQVKVSAAGFVQTLTISHKANVYFVPYNSGGSIRLDGVFDGGGGITLGVATSLGKINLPPLSPGQSVELQIP